MGSGFVLRCELKPNSSLRNKIITGLKKHSHKGYKCFSPSLNRYFISADVTFTYSSMSNSPTLFKSRCQKQFKYTPLSYYPTGNWIYDIGSDTETPFKDKIMMELQAPKEIVPQMWWLTLMMLSQWTWGRNITIVCENRKVIPKINPRSLSLQLGSLSRYVQKFHIA